MTGPGTLHPIPVGMASRECVNGRASMVAL